MRALQNNIGRISDAACRFREWATDNFYDPGILVTLAVLVAALVASLWIA